MSADRDARLRQRFRAASNVIGLLVMAAGAVVLLGWALDIALLKSLVPGHVTMKANTAFCFVLLGSALWLLQERVPHSRFMNGLGHLCAAFAMVIAVFTLLEYISDLQFGIDEVLFLDDEHAVHTFSPGRMASITALGFLLMGPALLLTHRQTARGFRYSDAFVLLAFLVVLFPLTGYLYGITVLVEFMHPHTAMAVHTSILFLLLLLGILFMRPDRGFMMLATAGGAAGIMMRLLLPATAVALLLMGWARMLGEQVGLYTSESGTALFVVFRVVLLGALIVCVTVLVRRLERVRDEAQRDLEEANLNLEQRVRKRTREVEESNKSLLEEVRHRAQVEEALRDSEGRLQAIVHGCPIAQFVIGRDHRVISWNKPLEEYTGITAEEVLGTTQQWRAFYPSERPCLADLILDHAPDHVQQWYGDKARPSRLVEEAFEATDFFPALGTRGRWLYFMAALIRGPEGEVIGAIETLEDITDRKRAEDDKLLDEQRLETLLKLNQMTRASLRELTDFVLEEAVRLTKSEIGYLAFTNEDESILTMYTWSRHAMEQCLIQDKPLIYPVAETGLWGEAIRQRKPVITNDYTAANPLKKGYPEGHVPVLRHMNIPVFDEGRVVAVAGVGNKEEPYEESDVRQLTLLMEGMWRLYLRTRNEDEMKRMRVYLQNVIDSMPSVLVGVDTEGVVTHWNAEAARMTGLREQESKGRHIGDVLPQLQQQLEKVRAAIREGHALENERFVVHSQEEGLQHFDLMIYPLVANGTKGAVVRLDDVTTRVQIEEMMVQTEKMMSVGGLAAGMAHEINNPLGGILQACQNIERRTDLALPKNVEVAQAIGADLALVRRYLEERGILNFVSGIRSDGARAAAIVSDMLAFSRRSESRLAPTDLTSVVDTVLRLAANDYDLKKQYDFRSVRIVREFQPNLPLVQCDKTKMEQVLLNLVKNAAQALAGCGKSAAPVITVRLTQEPHHACIEVLDNGPGMEESVRRRVFEPFFTTKEVGVGTGLGLSVSYFIITKQHKGTLSVESTPGEGTRFIVRLPLNEEA